MFQSLSSKAMLGVTVIVILVLSFILWWDFRYQEMQAENGLLIKAVLVATHHQVSRAFVSRSVESVHGEDASPLSPVEVRKGMDKLFAETVGSQVKQTHLVVREDANTPDPFERAALTAFAEDEEQTEVFARVIDQDGAQVFRYVAALRADASCLKCHGEPAGSIDPTGYVREGMKEGDLAGAISVTLPMKEAMRSARLESIRLAGGVVLLAVLVLVLIWLLLWRQVSRPLNHLVAVTSSMGTDRILIEPQDLAAVRTSRETAQLADAFATMSERLQEMYLGLEQKVADRTSELSRANEDLANAARLRAELMTMITHEFRTPLTSNMTFTELLLSDGQGTLTAGQREHLTDILEGTQRLMQLSNDLLDLSRLEAGRIRLFRDIFPVHELVRHATVAARPLAEKKQIELLVEIEPDLPLLHADDLRSTQVLVNLLGNAIKFTPEGGRITVTAQQAGAFVEVAVSDTGIGIDPADQERIFQPFQQAGKHRSEGSGLGLSLARSLVELHGGQIRVQSDPGQGATFRFTLPVWSEEG